MKKHTLLKIFLFRKIDRLSFWLFNLVILLYLIDILNKESINELIILGISLLTIVGSLSALSYTASQYADGKFDVHVFRIAGHRFFHSFISIIYVFVFTAVFILLKSGKISYIQNKIVQIIFAIPLIIISMLYVYRCGRSFSLGFHMIREILDRNFPLKNKEIINEDVRKAIKKELKTRYKT